MRLADSLIEVFAFVLQFQSTVDSNQPGLEEVREKLERLLARFQEECSDVYPDEIDHARFAVCAWADEVIAGSSWEHKQAWLKDQLQRRYFGTTDAGEEFFRRLDALGLHQREAREVYYLCLAVGFTGMYCRPGDEHKLEQLKTENLRLLLGGSAGLPTLERGELFPDAYPPAEGNSGAVLKPQRRFPVVTLACLAAPPLVFLVLFIVYRLALGTVAESFLKAVGS